MPRGEYPQDVQMETGRNLSEVWEDAILAQPVNLDQRADSRCPKLSVDNLASDLR